MKTYEEARAQRDALYARWDALTDGQRRTALGWLCATDADGLEAAIGNAEGDGA